MGKMISRNCVAFTMLYAGSGQASVMSSGAGPLGPCQAMLVALVVTFVGFITIFILFFLQNLECTGKRVDDEIKALISPIGVLIGFSWKQAFVAAISTITSEVH